MPHPSSRRILVTSALPYASGQPHLGHMLEYIQSDIWVRLHKMLGHTCYHVCGSDAHGTPIMLSAKKLNITPEQLVEQASQDYQAAFAAFNIQFDQFHTTHSEENRTLSEQIFHSLKDKGDISEKVIKQAYDQKASMFLPDRFVKGTCPSCRATDQYGDNCEACGNTYSPMELIDPLSVISGEPPIEKESSHLFFELNHYASQLKSWTEADHLQPQIKHKLNEWFESGLKSWDITRDGPYFGFKIPGRENQYFYVWLDAPIGYMASFKKLTQNQPEINFDEFWSPDSQTELYHFIGKDIVYFHALFWPAILMGSGFRTPTAIFAHGYLTINGQKMSKSRGTFITANQYLSHFDAEYLRYYYAAKLNEGVDDLDLNFEDFGARINSDLVGKFVNIASRVSKFINQNFDNQLSETLPNLALYTEFAESRHMIANYFQARQYNKAIREIMQLADKANRYIDDEKPWQKIKIETQFHEVQAICTQGLNLFRVLATFLKPVLPATTSKIEVFLNSGPLEWNALDTPLLGQTIKTYQPLITRIQTDEIQAMMKANSMSEQTEKNTNHDKSNEATQLKEIMPTISIDDFAKIDLRIAKITHAESVPKADKLLKLQVDIGGEQRQIFAGIKSAYQPEDLIGQLTVVVANLAPREMRFGRSEGMVLAAGPGGNELWILNPHEGAQPGMRVK